MLLLIFIFFIYIIFIFYEEIFYKRILTVGLNVNILKKYISLKFALKIDIYSIVERFFGIFVLFNRFNLNIKFNFFKRPDMPLRLFLFNLIYNFSAFFFIISFRSVFEWTELLKWLILLEIEPEPEFWVLVAKKGSFLMYMLFLIEFIIIIAVLCFMWWKFEYTVLIPLNIFFIMCCFFSFFFNFFWKSIIYLLIHFIGLIFIWIPKISIYYLKVFFINFYNNFWFCIKRFMWYRSTLLIRIWICTYAFITFNFIVLFIYLFIYNTLFFNL